MKADETTAYMKEGPNIWNYLTVWFGFFCCCFVMFLWRALSPYISQRHSTAFISLRLLTGEPLHWIRKSAGIQTRIHFELLFQDFLFFLRFQLNLKQYFELQWSNHAVFSTRKKHCLKIRTYFDQKQFLSVLADKVDEVYFSCKTRQLVEQNLNWKTV